MSSLYSELEALGELIADNLTAKGVTASPYEGLTTLANKVLQITGGGTTVIFEEDGSVDHSNTLFGEHISLRNSGTGTATYNNNGYYVLTNTKANAEAFIEFPQLQGIYNKSFKVTARSQGTTTYRCPVALYYYLDDNNWGGVKDEIAYVWTSAKTNGTFTENSTATGNSNNVEVVSEFIFDVDENTLTVNDYVGGVLKGTKSMTIPVTLNSNVKWGTTTTWANNTSRNLYEIKAEYIGISLGSGNCYNVKFTENSDTESSGNVAILEVFARYQYQPLANTSLTITGSDNSTYTATTDSNGLATFNVNISADTTYTCTYQGKSDSINVVYSEYLFFDACSSATNLSKYDSPINIYNTSLGGTPTMTYDSTENAYALYGSSTSDYVIFPIPKLNGESNFTFSCEIKLSTSSSYPQIGLGVMPNESQLTGTYAEVSFIYRYDTSQVSAYAQRRRRKTSSNMSTGRLNHAPNNWLRIKIVYNSSNGFTTTWEEVSDGSILKTYTGTISADISDRHYGIYMRCYSSNSYKGFIRNIKAERNE